MDKKDFNSNNPLLMTAIREAQEESKNTFKIMSTNHINNKILKNNTYIDKKFGNTFYYRCFFVYIYSNVFSKKMFHYNSHIINNSDFSNSWKETNDVQRFYISDLLIYGLLKTNKDFQCIDTNGKIREISYRTLFLLQDGIKKNIHLLVLCKPLYLTKIIDKTNNDTISLISTS